MDVDREVKFLRFLCRIDDRLNRVRDADSAIALGLRMVREFFEADASCLAVLMPGRDRVELRLRQPGNVAWDEQQLVEFLNRRRPKLSSAVLLGLLERRERPWAAICLRRTGDRFTPDAVGEIRQISERISKLIQRTDRLRIADARTRINQKIVEQLRPKDLFYQILHSLRALTHYDHSSALLTYEEGPETLTLVAEQIAWRKGKSGKIGWTRPLSTDARALLESGRVLAFDKEQDDWRPRRGQVSPELADLLDYDDGRGGEAEDGTARTLVCAPLRTRDSLLGVLKIASRNPRSLGHYEMSLVEEFLPYPVVAIRNLHRTQSLEAGMLEAEKKSVMADLARGVSHDINNAMGAVLPLVQQLIADERERGGERKSLAGDLEQIESSLQVCRRIFGGMLSMARGSTRTVGQGDVRRAIENTLAILDEGMKRHAVDVQVDLPDLLPLVRSGQGDLEQLLLNLASNARDAMPGGGELVIQVRRLNGRIQIELRDTGAGIAADDLGRVQEPFFTTKNDGNGLGLSICRSIVWENRGSMKIDSEPGRGTNVSVRLPLADPKAAEEGR